MTNKVTVSGGADVNPANNTVRDSPNVTQSVMIAPTKVVAVAISPSQINLTWDSVTGATSYQIFRSSNSAYSLVGTSTTTGFNNTTLAADTTYIYEVGAVSDSGSIGPRGMRDLATTIQFFEDPVMSGLTVIKAVHLTQLRTAVSSVVLAAGQGVATYKPAISIGSIITAAQVEELRTKLLSARTRSAT